MFKVSGFKDLTEEDLSSPKNLAEFLIPRTFDIEELRREVPQNLSKLTHRYDLGGIFVPIINPSIIGLEGEFRLYTPSGGRVSMNLLFRLNTGVYTSDPLVGTTYKELGTFEAFQEAINEMYCVGSALKEGHYKLELKRCLDSYVIQDLTLTRP